METIKKQTPFFKPKVVQRADIKLDSPATILFKKLLISIVAVAIGVIIMLGVYLVVKDDAPKVIIQTETIN